MEIKVVTVIGANGTMGCNVSGIFASFGNARVYMVARDKTKAENAIEKAASSVRAESIKRNLIPADYSEIPECVSKSQLVFESVIEDIDIKSKITELISESAGDDTFICTGTSGLSVEKLAECCSERTRPNYFGVHMFNPPYSMTLTELISTSYSDPGKKEELSEYLKNTLFRTVVDVKDSPAFLANRIGFQFINEALQYAEKYKDNGGIDYIDSIIGPYTGRAMAPITTADFVGLDVHRAIVDNLYKNTSDYARETFVLPTYVSGLIEQNRLGRKTGCGVYQRIKYENGLKRDLVYDISSDSYRDRIKYTFPFSEKMIKCISRGDYVKAFEALVSNRSLEADICLSFLLKYIVYAMFSAKCVGDSLDAADDVMATGFNWCPPIAMYNVLNSVTDVKSLTKKRFPDIYNSADVEKLLAEAGESKYDFRRYFKSRK